MVSPNQTLINEKRDTVFRCLIRVKSKIPLSLAELEIDFDLQDILVLNLERIVQACVDIASHLVAYTNLPAPATMADAFASLNRSGILSLNVSQKMQKAVGLRNLLVHEYKKIDWTILWAVLQNHLEDFTIFLEEIESKLMLSFPE